jgi:hypothetical protein
VAFLGRRHEVRLQLFRYAVLALALFVAPTGCVTGLGEELGVVRAGDLAGTYTGVLQGVTVANLADLEDPRRRVIVDLDLLHELTIRDVGAMTVRIESPIIPPLRAIVVGFGAVAINAELVEFEQPGFEALKVKQIVFVQYEGEWVVVLQLIRAGDELYVYQYVSYPSAVADRLSQEEAIVYVNTILRLASAVQRRCC